MFLHRIHLDPRCREARRDLADPYQLHSTLCRAFSSSDRKCPAGEFLWRHEPETDRGGHPRLLVQGRTLANWSNIGVRGWLAEADPAINLQERLKLDTLKSGQHFRFRLRANPCVTRDGKRLGLLRLADQENWITRKGELHGFMPQDLASFDLSEKPRDRIDVRISHEQILQGNPRAGNPIRIFSVLYDGILTVTEPDKFRDALLAGIGHGKSMGLGLLSVAPS